jgi:hypothetical protein
MDSTAKVPVVRPPVPFGLDVRVGRDGSVVILPALRTPAERAVSLRMAGDGCR